MSAARASSLAFVVTCEHAGNRIPARYRDCFGGQREVLKSHHGYDRGALRMAKDLAERLGAPLFHSTVSRLLVDLNRSPGHRRLHAQTIRALPPEARDEILARHYTPVRSKAEQAVAQAIAAGKHVIHISSHSFTPVLDGAVRTADVGLLYDPQRGGELALCQAWQSSLCAREPQLRVRRNYPYTGKSDGFTAFLRRRYSANRYTGIELEINQRIALTGGRAWARLRSAITGSLVEALRETTRP